MLLAAPVSYLLSHVITFAVGAYYSFTNTEFDITAKTHGLLFFTDRSHKLKF